MTTDRPRAGRVELISCLTVTRPGRLTELERSVRCFSRQTLAEREQVIVHDGDAATHSAILELVSRYPEERIVVRREQRQRSLGYLRNLSLESANGTVVCQWDDDDMYHPLRLQRQYGRLKQERADFCFFTDQLHWFELRNHLYWDDWSVEDYPMNLIQGTIMGRKDKIGTYPDLSRGEDTPLVVGIVERGCRVTALEGQGFLYIYVYNGRNAWDFRHHAAITSWKRLRLEQLAPRIETLARHLADYDWPSDHARLPHDSGILEIRVPRRRSVDQTRESAR